MEKNIDKLSILYMLFVLILGISGTVGGIGGRIIYYSAFILPFIIGIFTRDRESSVYKIGITPTGKGLKYTLPFAAPFVLLIMLLSLLTSLLLGALGFNDTTDVSGNIFIAVIKHAAAPSILEECLFRFMPLMLIADSSRKNALLFSSLSFSFIHCNLFQIPYAFAAGFILALLTLLSGSILPGIVLHFLNNLFSLLMLRNTDKVFITVAFCSIGMLTIVSLTYVYIKRKDYISDLKEIFTDKCKLKFTNIEILFIALTLTISILNLVNTI